MLNYIILGMLYNCKLTGYDLKKYIENGVGTFYKASYGSIYPSLKRLSENKLVTVMNEQQGSRQKKVYDITSEGRQVFLKWLTEPINLDDGGGNQSHLARVYFFDILPSSVVEQQLLEYEIHNTKYLRHLLALKTKFESPEIHENYYYKLSTLYYGITIVNEIIRWCRHVRGKRPLDKLLDGGNRYEQSE